MKKINLIIIIVLIAFQGLHSEDALKLIHPNGGEVLKAGGVTKITWEGAKDSTKVRMDFSSDKGATWSRISNDTNGVSFDWKAPLINSDSCLVKIINYKPSDYKESDLIAQRNYGGSNEDAAETIIKTKDGGYLITGTTGSYDFDVTVNKGQSDCLIIKTDTYGKVEWSKSYGGSGVDGASRAIECPDGGFLIAGTSKSSDYDISKNFGGSDILILKLDKIGNLLWEKSLGGSINEYFGGIAITDDNGFIIVGSTNSNDGEVSVHKNKIDMDIWVVKIDSLGEVLWDIRMGGENDDRDEGLDIVSIDGNSFMILTNFTHYTVNSDAKLFRINQDGEILWEKTYGGSYTDVGVALEKTNDGGYIFCGRTFSKDGDISNPQPDQHLWVVKLDSLGKIEWENTYLEDLPTDIIQLSDGGYLFTSQLTPKFMINKIDNKGKLEYNRYFGSNRIDVASSILETNRNSILVAGIIRGADRDVTNSYGNYDAWVIEIAGPAQPLYWDTSDDAFSIIDPKANIANDDNNFDLNVYYNIYENSANITFGLTENGITSLELYNSNGAKLKTLSNGYETIGTKEIPLDLSNYANGRYYIKLTTPTITKTEILEVVR